MAHIDDLKKIALLDVTGRSNGQLNDLEHLWLLNDLGLTQANNVLQLNDLWYKYLVQEGVTATANLNDMKREWLDTNGYTGSLQDQMAAMWADGPVSPTFKAIVPEADGTISVEPAKGTGSATFTRSGTVAHVREYDNNYTLVAANEARIQGARRVAGIYYWKLADGTPLHPIVTKKGATVFARYADWVADETSLTVGVNRIPITGSGTAGGNGFWYQISAITTGTAGATEPTWPTTIGNTVVDNGVTWTNKGYYRLAGYLGEPAAENVILQSRAFDTTWTNVGTVQTQDQGGIDGVANTAWQLEDNDGAGYEYVNQNNTVIPADSNDVCLSVYFLKDSDTTRFPCLVLSIDTGGTLTYEFIHVNTQTGATTAALSAGIAATSYGSEDHEDWWRVWIVIANDGSNTRADAYIRPADGTVFGTRSNAATGTCVVDQAQLELNTSVPSSPISTTTASVTRNADALSHLVSGNQDQTAGTVYANVIPLFANTDVTGDIGIISLSDIDASVLYLDSTNNTLESTDGTNVASQAKTWSNGDNLSLAAAWSGTALTVASDGTTGTPGTYDGAFVLGTDMHIGYTPTSPTIFSDIRLYNKEVASFGDFTDYD